MNILLSLFYCRYYSFFVNITNKHVNQIVVTVYLKLSTIGLNPSSIPLVKSAISPGTGCAEGFAIVAIKTLRM